MEREYASVHILVSRDYDIGVSSFRGPPED